MRSIKRIGYGRRGYWVRCFEGRTYQGTTYFSVRPTGKDTDAKDKKETQKRRDVWIRKYLAGETPFAASA